MEEDSKYHKGDAESSEEDNDAIISTPSRNRDTLLKASQYIQQPKFITTPSGGAQPGGDTEKSTPQ